MTRAVFDSTVLISAFLRPGGVSDELVGLASDAAYTLVLAPEILDETTQKLLSSSRIRRRYLYEDADVREYSRALRLLAELVTDLPLVSGVVRDPNDDMVIACALKGQAGYIVTRDDDLLSLKAHQDVTMIAPESFRMLLRGRA